MNKLENIENVLLSERIAQERIILRLEEKKKKIIKLKRKQKNTELARKLLQEVAKKTQAQVQYQISEIVSLALNAVFPDNYEFKIEFVDKNGKTEADIFLEKDRERFDILRSTGGGVVDIVSFALRIALWNLSNPKTRNTIILDEPFKHLRGKDIQPKAGIMLKEISKKLNIQFIIISHENVIIDSADKVFEIKQIKGVSHCYVTKK